MKHYWKLVNFEFDRVAKGYGSLLLFTILTQIATVFFVARSYMKNIQDLIFTQQITEKAALEQVGRIDMLNVTRTAWFNAPIALVIATLLLYCLFIWYRDWLGKNTFIYRLLMLPVNRMALFFSKLTVIFVAVLGLIGTQLILLSLESKLLAMLVPAAYRTTMSLIEIITFSEILSIVIPSTFIHFLVIYGVGFLAVIVLFTGIVMERSFQFKGLLMAGMYALFSGFMLLLPVLLEATAQKALFYPSELFLLTNGIGIILTALSFTLSHYLLNHKITV